MAGRRGSTTAWVAVAAVLVSLVALTALETTVARPAAAVDAYPDMTPGELVTFLDRSPLPGTVPGGPAPITGDRSADDRIRWRAERTDYRVRPRSAGPLSGAAGVPLNPEATDALQRMAAAARSAGAPFTPVSGFRSPDDQRGIFLGELAQRGRSRIGRPYTNAEIAAGAADAAIDDVLRLNSVPGYSFHHTGDAVDLVAPGGSLSGFSGSAAYRWLSGANYANAKRFGFLPSYPVGATAIGPDPEPWEFTYVGERAIRCAADRVALADRTPGRCPGGSLDGVQVEGTTARIIGWAADADAPDRPVDVHLYVDGAGLPVRADVDRPDVGAGTPFGPRHGFDVRLDLAPGGHTVCAHAINDVPGETSTLLGCLGFEVRTTAPVGFVDRLVPSGSGLLLEGWTADPDLAFLPLGVHVYVDGVGRLVKADQPRPDVDAALGLGPDHGFSVWLDVAEGPHRVCAYALTPQPAEGNPLLGCREAVALGSSPIGTLDRTVGVGGEVVVDGWAVDADRPGATVAVDLYLDLQVVATVPADQPRPDVDAAFGVGPAHGFAARLSAAAGTRVVCAVARSDTPGEPDRGLGCRLVDVPGTPPVGFLDDAAGRPGAVDVLGWAADPSRPAEALDVHVYVDGRGVAVRADRSRPDVAAATGFGGDHGYEAVVAASPGRHVVCAYAIAVDPGEGNSLLGCRVVDVPGG